MAESGKQFVERVNMVYRSTGPGGDVDVELPFRILVIGDFSLDEQSEYFETQQPIEITHESLNAILNGFDLKLTLQVVDRISGSGEDMLRLEIPIRSIQDFSPLQIANHVAVFAKFKKFRDILTKLSSNSAGSELVELLESLGNEKQINGLLKSLDVSYEDGQLLKALERDTLNFLISDIDDRLSQQMDEILHHPSVRELESSWKALAFLLERTDFRENIVIEILNVSKQALIDDFEDVPETIQSNLYQTVYSSEFGQFGGRPYSCILGNYIFGPAAPDIALLQKITNVASMSHAPFITAAGSEFFDIDNYSQLTRVRNFAANFQQPKFMKWVSLRESEDSRYLGLTLPGFILRQAFDEINKANIWFPYNESFLKTQQKGLWGNSCFAFATRLVDSFAKYRWCSNITGKPDGEVAGLHLTGHASQASKLGKIPTQILIPDRRDSELAAYGFIPLSVHKGDDCAAFYTANSAQLAPSFGDSEEAKVATLNYQLGGQIPYLFVISRVSHYIKMMQREHIGSWKTKQEINKEINNWLKQYVSDMDNPAPGVRGRRPLRRAEFNVEEVAGKAGWFLIHLKITPHLKYMGATFTLSETGKLDKN